MPGFRERRWKCSDGYWHPKPEVCWGHDDEGVNLPPPNNLAEKLARIGQRMQSPIIKEGDDEDAGS